MNTQELKDYKKKCLAFIERAKDNDRTIVKTLCPECLQENENVLAHKGTWNGNKSDFVTKGCYECGKAYFAKMNETQTVSFKIEPQNIKHVYEQ